jgi:hypothetical protein
MEEDPPVQHPFELEVILLNRQLEKLRAELDKGFFVCFLFLFVFSCK